MRDIKLGCRFSLRPPRSGYSRASLFGRPFNTSKKWPLLMEQDGSTLIKSNLSFACSFVSTWFTCCSTPSFSKPSRMLATYMLMQINSIRLSIQAFYVCKDSYFSWLFMLLDSWIYFSKAMNLISLPFTVSWSLLSKAWMLNSCKWQRKTWRT